MKKNRSHGKLFQRAFPKFSLRIKYAHKLCIYIDICIYDTAIEKVTKSKREN